MTHFVLNRYQQWAIQCLKWPQEFLSPLGFSEMILKWFIPASWSFQTIVMWLEPSAAFCSVPSSTPQGHRAVWWKMHHRYSQCLLSCLSVRAVSWHHAFSGGSWRTRNISTSLCQTVPASQSDALWWPRWQWQTDNDWMLHFTSLTFFLKNAFFFSPLSLPQLSVEVEKVRTKGWLRKITFRAPRTLIMKTHGSVGRTCQRRFRLCFSTLHGWTPGHFLPQRASKTRSHCSWDQLNRFHCLPKEKNATAGGWKSNHHPTQQSKTEVIEHECPCLCLF